MTPELHLYGVFFPHLFATAAVALVPFLLIQIAMRRWRLYRFVWHRSLFEIALFVALTGAVSSLPLTFIH
ncbi:DUF1656 domain-containing protein [Novosphingobium sp. EMRT-2]|jgi:hypothetical protein|uniref:DUF1656 domain-containing protein n=1 Tax=Novosphingobium sp. EMRT-2 TaxID=2571749 RepID=UPI0010BD18E0|nr:DUF1656 domain-containing protein [Novosphingobium sp. EMRT-2]QCI95073.1 DUF1656 domain-containing protein [Novosphingobium sp. EMRT-2]